MMLPLFIGGIGAPELVLIFLLVILLFGADKLPKLARSSGEAMGEFQKGREEVERELRAAKETTVSTRSTAEDADESDDDDATAELLDADEADDVAETSDVTDTNASPA